jgi:sporulation protein YlmC with PRC-barrel domain
VRVLEVHVEQLLGRKVIDSDGRVVGRIEEMRAELVDGERVVTEFHLGSAALLERFGSVVIQLPLFHLFGSTKTARSVPWNLVDLSDPRHPRLRGRLDEIGTPISRSDRPSHPS